MYYACMLCRFVCLFVCLFLSYVCRQRGATRRNETIRYEGEGLVRCCPWWWWWALIDCNGVEKMRQDTPIHRETIQNSNNNNHKREREREREKRVCEVRLIQQVWLIHEPRRSAQYSCFCRWRVSVVGVGDGLRHRIRHCHRRRPRLWRTPMRHHHLLLLFLLLLFRRVRRVRCVRCVRPPCPAVTAEFALRSSSPLLVLPRCCGLLLLPLLGSPFLGGGRVQEAATRYQGAPRRSLTRRSRGGSRRTWRRYISPPPPPLIPPCGDAASAAAPRRTTTMAAAAAVFAAAALLSSCCCCG